MSDKSSPTVMTGFGLGSRSRSIITSLLVQCRIDTGISIRRIA